MRARRPRSLRLLRVDRRELDDCTEYDDCVPREDMPKRPDCCSSQASLHQSQHSATLPSRRLRLQTMNSGFFTFINDSLVQKTVRERELDRAKALAHAATVSYQSRATKRRSSGVVLQLLSPACSQDSIPHPPECSDEEAAEDSARKPSTTSSQCFTREGADALAAYNNASSTKLNKYQRTRKTSHLHDVTAYVTPAPHSGFGCFRGELFSSVPYGEDTNVRTIVDFHSQCIMPRHDLAPELFDFTNIYVIYIDFLNCPFFYYAGLAITSIIRDRLMDPDSSPSAAFLQHKGRAMKRVRTHLQRPDWQDFHKRAGLLNAIVSFALCEAAMGQTDQAQKHMLGLKRITDTHSADFETCRPKIVSRNGATCCLSNRPLR